MTLRAMLDRILDVPTSDPDDARRGKLLNILLLGVGVLTIFQILLTGIILIVSPRDVQPIMLAGGIGVLVGIGGIYMMNRSRRLPRWIAASLFLILLTTVFTLMDPLQELIDGRSTVVYVIPIIMGSVLLHSSASFLVAVLIGGLFGVIGWRISHVPNPFAILAFLAMALVAWLSGRSLEHALRDLRQLNMELDQRVQDRTRDLAEALAKNQAILDSTADGVIVFDRAKRVVVANPAISVLLGDRVCAPGMDLETLLGDSVSAEDKEMLVEVMNRHEMRSGIKFSWGRKTFSASLAPVRDNADQVTGTVVVLRDFTREAEVDRMKSTFVSIASHELRTPLNAIMGYAEMLREGVYGALDDKQAGAVGRVITNTGHMLSLVNNLLDRARIEAGTLELNLALFRPIDIVHNTQGVMEMMASTKGLTLTCSVDENMPPLVLGDRQRLNQIAINLVGNAIKFTEQGSVTMRIFKRDPDHWVISVRDTGCGIPKEAQSYIFDPFRQVDDSATREYGGAGLGLSIVKQLVELMNGWIELESEVGKGSTFTIVLPLMTESPPEEE